jgi:pimeloyl-ACP methyl ester carboxylesterase
MIDAVVDRTRTGRQRFAAHSSFALVSALVAVAFLAASASASASALNVSGTWHAVYHCEVGWCAGGEFPATDVLTQAEGSSEVSGSNGSEELHGSLSGNTLTLETRVGEYSSHAVLTISANGLSWEGPLSDSHETSGYDKATREATKATILGLILDTQGKPAYGVTVTLSGTNDEGAAISETTKTNSTGKYGFEVAPGNYAATASGDPPQQNGGKLTVAAKPGLSPAETADLKGTGSIGLGTETEPEPPGCTGTGKEATCTLTHLEAGERGIASFTYTYCGSTEREPNKKQATGCPIIFIPGFLGSKMFCGARELWVDTPNPKWAELQLQGNGITDAGAPGSCNSMAGPISGEAGVVTSVGVPPAGIDIYGAVLEYLNQIAPGHVYAYPYDWRKSPVEAVSGLATLVDEVLEKTGAKHVVLAAHSMGGIVLQSFIEDPANAEKVNRAVTIGTPYWGAVKSHVALLTGKSNEIAQETFGLDLLTKSSIFEETELSGGNEYANDLQIAARNMQGIFWLYPSDNFGPWLQIIAKGFPSGLLKTSQIRTWVSSLGGSPQLITNAVAGHAKFDGFKPNGVDYEIVVGAGVPTETALQIAENPAGLEQPVTVWYASGDGTVPLVSATQGGSEGREMGATVPIHYVCEVSHLALTGNVGVQNRIEGFLLKGEPVKDSTTKDENCPYVGQLVKVFEPIIPEHGLAHGAAVQHRASITVQTAGGSMSLEAARAAGLVTTLQAGGVRFVATNDAKAVTLSVAGSGVAVEVRSLTSGGKGPESGDGPAILYGPVTGTITVGPKDLVEHAGRRLRPVRDRRPPVTSAHVSRHGKRSQVRLSARSTVGVAATYYRIGKKALVRYTKPFTVTAAQLKALRFESVDRFGKWEHAERVRGSHRQPRG